MLNKLANYWINPKGGEYELLPSDIHRYFIANNFNISEEEALNKGWIRVANIKLNGETIAIQCRGKELMIKFLKENKSLISKVDELILEWSPSESKVFQLPEDRKDLTMFIEIGSIMEQLQRLTKKKVILKEERTDKSVVGIVMKPGYILMGKAVTDDDRNGWLCFPGGGVEENESLARAAKREVREETNLFVKPFIDNSVTDKRLPNIIFIICKYINGEIQHNSEFESMKWYNVKELPWEEIFPQNRELLKSLLS